MRPVLCYLRVAQTSRGYRVLATSRPSAQPITDTVGGALPTIEFGLRIKLPEGAFIVPVLPTLDVELAHVQPGVDVELEVVEP